MTYSKNINRRSIAKRVFVSWVAIALIALVSGYIIGAVFNKDTEVLAYGAADGREFDTEMSIDWGDDLEFAPLDVPMSEELQEFVFYLSYGYGIDWTFTMAVIQKESNYQADTVSATNDYGLMQINQCNHAAISEAIGTTDFLNPYENVRAGLWILRNLFEKYETPEKVLMAYNMGETGAKILWENGIFETNYSKTVLQIQDELKG